MASARQVIAELAAELGLNATSASGTSYGATDGFLLQLTPTKDSQGSARITIGINYLDPSQDDRVRLALETDPGLAAGGIKPKRVTVDGGLLTHDHGPKMQTGQLTGSFNVDQLRQAVAALLGVVRRTVPVPAPGCRVCGNRTPVAPMLVNGAVDRMCPSCVSELQTAAVEAQAAYDARPIRFVPAVLAAVVVAALGAALWAGVVVATERMFWLLAIGIGGAIGVITAKAAGRGGLVVQAMAIVASVISTLAGNVAYVAYHIQKEATEEGAAVDWAAFLGAVPSILVAGGSDTLFALGGGLIGAFYAARQTGRQKIEVKVE